MAHIHGSPIGLLWVSLANPPKSKAAASQHGGVVTTFQVSCLRWLKFGHCFKCALKGYQDKSCNWMSLLHLIDYCTCFFFLEVSASFLTTFDHKVKCTDLPAESLCLAKTDCQIERSESQAAEFSGRCIGDTGGIVPQFDRLVYWTLPVCSFIAKRRAVGRGTNVLMFEQVFIEEPELEWYLRGDPATSQPTNKLMVGGEVIHSLIQIGNFQS